ncbi:MAG: SPOR domain-containing protein [Spirochaetes bacterium]|nr:SPOR domain-containing protein [Spirochaetota bacterium]
MVDEYWIQASSFASRERAEGLKASLAEKGLASVITVKDVDGKSYFRVRIGPYSKKGEADGWLSRIKAFDGCDEAFVSKTTVERTI